MKTETITFWRPDGRLARFKTQDVIGVTELPDTHLEIRNRNPNSLRSSTFVSIDCPPRVARAYLDWVMSP